MTGLLSESRFDAAVQGAPIHHRAALYSHFALLEQRIKALEAQLAAVPPPAPPAPPPLDPTEAIDRAIADTRQQVRESIVTWLRVTHTADTVRAAYARKLAGLIEDGADESDAPTEEHAA